jgi:hypothetical protein
MRIQHHYDKLEQEILIDDYVAFPQSNGLMVGKVVKLSNKMLIIEAVIAKKIRRRTLVKETYRKYPADAVKLTSDVALTMFLIRNS